MCDCLGIGNPSQATKDLLDDEKNTLILNEGIRRRGNPNVTIVSESGLYSLIMRSRKKEAIEFQRWVTREVLPSIRRTGGYSLQDAERVTAYKEDSNYWFEMYNRILDDYANAMLERDVFLEMYCANCNSRSHGRRNI